MKKHSFKILTTMSLVSALLAPAALQSAAPVHAAATSGQVSVSAQKAFVNKIAPVAQKVAAAYGVYPSVMIAQAILESNWGTSTLASAPNYNLFGMKASDWSGPTVKISTQEWDSNAGKYITVKASFRKYSGFYDSLADNAKKLRYGLSWSPTYYQGTWLEKAESSQDSTSWLQGRYATSPAYASSLNRVIAENNLTQYDPQVKKASGTVTVLASGASVYTGFCTASGKTGKVLAAGSKWAVKKVAAATDGSYWYNLGGAQWVPAASVSLASQSAQGPKPAPKPEAKPEAKPQTPSQTGAVITKFRGVAQVHYVPGYGIAVWNTFEKGRKYIGKKLQDGTRWQVYKKAVVNGQTWYCLGGNQWLDGKYLNVQ